MTATETKTKTFAREAKSIIVHLTKAAKLHGQGQAEEVKAGELLTTVKAGLAHGQFRPWLIANKIHPRTAARAMAEFKDPDGATRNKEQKNRKERAQRAAAKAAKAAKKAAQTAKALPADKIRSEVLSIVNKMNSDEIAELYGWLMAREEGAETVKMTLVKKAA